MGSTAQTTRDFDPVAHYRARAQRAERRAAALEHIRNRLERLLAIALRAAAGNDCDPTVLLTVIEQLDTEAQKGRTFDELAQLLRETAPERSRKAAAA